MIDPILTQENMNKFNTVYRLKGIRSYIIEKVEHLSSDMFEQSIYGIVHFSTHGWCGNDRAQTHHKLAVCLHGTDLHNDDEVSYEDYAELTGAIINEPRLLAPMKKQYHMDVFFNLSPYVSSDYNHTEGKRTYTYHPSALNKSKYPFDVKEDVK